MEPQEIVREFRELKPSQVLGALLALVIVSFQKILLSLIAKGNLVSVGVCGVLLIGISRMNAEDIPDAWSVAHTFVNDPPWTYLAWATAIITFLLWMLRERIWHKREQESKVSIQSDSTKVKP